MSHVEARPQPENGALPGPAADPVLRCFTPDAGLGALQGSIRHVAAAFPDGVVGNAELTDRFGLPADWIVERCGISQRRTGGDVAALAADAASRALAAYPADDIDLLILATSSGESRMPATAADVARRLGLHCATFDLNAACTGFVYALLTAYGFLTLGTRAVLVVGADAMSRMVDPDDRNTAILFGDGAGAAIVSRAHGDDAAALLGWHASTDPSAYDLLYAGRDTPLTMDGRAVFRYAVRGMADSAARAMTAAGVTPDEIALFVPHQANARIIDAGCQRLGIDETRVASTLATTGNTSAASVPIALSAAIDERDLRRGDLVLLSGFGAGMTCASAVVRW
ncbi:MAG TPA: beta-ketoacyl-ACP synthase 3 [Acidimicrobiia bacterium]